MKESLLDIDRKNHVIYTPKCRKVILKHLREHYPEDEVDDVFMKIQLQYVEYLKTFRKDLGGKKNPSNGKAGTFDSIMLFSCYVVLGDKTSFNEIEEICREIFIGKRKHVPFVDCNRRFFKKLMYRAFIRAEKRCEQYHDYEMTVEPYREGEPLRYKFTTCPVAAFAREHNLLDILPALCNVDYPAISLFRARLIRTTTLGRGECCDYAIVGDRDPYIKKHEEYRDENGAVWNK